MPHYEEISVNHLEGTTQATFGGRSRSVKGNVIDKKTWTLGLRKKKQTCNFQC